jgi:hypothetical protein
MADRTGKASVYVKPVLTETGIREDVREIVTLGAK